jgi:hypothetical protein
MTFEIGNLVKWKNDCHVRLGYTPSDIGQVVGVYGDPAWESEIDVVFGDGNVLHGAAGGWFDPVDDVAVQN